MTIIEKGKETVRAVAEHAEDLKDFAGEKISDLKNNAEAQVKEGYTALQMKFHNPLFLEELKSGEKAVPDLITIIDDDEKKGVEVCKGSLGWISKENGLNVLHLFNKEVSNIEKQFVPYELLYEVYLRDPYDSDSFVVLQDYFKKMEEAKVAELENIAHSLGAKKCEIELIEEKKKIEKKDKNGHVKGNVKVKKAKAEISEEIKLENIETEKSKIVSSTEFKGNSKPVRPELKWFKKDEKIKGLIAAVCSETVDNKMSKQRFTIDRSSSKSMSREMAAKIDGAISKLGFEGNMNMESEVLTESRKIFVFSVEF